MRTDANVSTDLEPLDLEIVLPFTGEVVPLAEPERVAEALDQVREMKRTLDDARATLEDALVTASEHAGTRTLRLGKLTAVVSGGERTEYDAEELMAALRELGMPEQRIAELVVETVTYRVDQRVARSVAAANPAYREALERCRETVPVPYRVSVKRG